MIWLFVILRWRNSISAVHMASSDISAVLLLSLLNLLCPLLTVTKPPSFPNLKSHPFMEMFYIGGTPLQKYWDQFETSIHNCSGLTNAEKLVYLQQVIRNGSARTAIQGLSLSGDEYDGAIICLKGRYNRTCLIHRTLHVQTIKDTPHLKDGSSKELCHLHDTLQRRLRALKTMKSEPDPSFITSIIGLKLDETTLFECQKHSQEKVDEIPHYLSILEFIDLCAQASESEAKCTIWKTLFSHREGCFIHCCKR